MALHVLYSCGLQISRVPTSSISIQDGLYGLGTHQISTSADPLVSSVPAATAYAEDDAARERIGAFRSDMKSVNHLIFTWGVSGRSKCLGRDEDNEKGPALSLIEVAKRPK